MIPIYVITQCVEERMHTPRMLRDGGVSFILVVDNTEQHEKALEMGYKQILVTNTTDIVSKRNQIDEINQDGWYLGMDDNIRRFTVLADPLYDEESVPVEDTSRHWRTLFRKSCDPKDYIARLDELRIMCIANETVFGGVATCENPYFRACKYSYRRFVKTKIFVMKGGSVQFKHRLCHDSYATALTVAKYGKVVVNNFMHYDARWYEKGGLGNRVARDAAGFNEQLDSVMEEFPGLVTRARGKNSALRIALTQDKSVNNWRRNHGYLKSGRIL